MFNIIDYSSGLKADLIFRKDRPFSREEFRRRKSGRIMGVEADVASPEDTILTKLEWSVMGNSTRQVEDAIEIAKIANQQLDRNYLTYWADQLSLRPQLQEVLSQIEAPPFLKARFQFSVFQFSVFQLSGVRKNKKPLPLKPDTFFPMSRIHAIFENGVFRPTESVPLPDRCEVELTVLVTAGGPNTPLKRLASLAERFTPNPGLPTDLAAQHDHYLYGSPKRP